MARTLRDLFLRPSASTGEDVVLYEQLCERLDSLRKTPNSVPELAAGLKGTPNKTLQQTAHAIDGHPAPVYDPA
jgi:hypothetical protein